MANLRDFNDDLSTHLASADPSIHASNTLMWTELSPTSTAIDSALGVTDQKISELETSRLDAAWESDTLKLAKDAALVAKLLRQVDSNQKTDRLAKITHIKEQNRIGAGIVTSFCEKNCRHVSLASGEADGALSQAIPSQISCDDVAA